MNSLDARRRLRIIRMPTGMTDHTTPQGSARVGSDAEVLTTAKIYRAV